MGPNSKAGVNRPLSVCLSDAIPVILFLKREVFKYLDTPLAIWYYVDFG